MIVAPWFDGLSVGGVKGTWGCVGTYEKASLLPWTPLAPRTWISQTRPTYYNHPFPSIVTTGA